MSVGERYPMAELVRRTGVAPATIRHYLTQGLIPSPDRVATNRFLYDRRHEQALNLVKLLRERRQMPLSEIRRILPSLAKMPDQQAFRPEMWDQVTKAHARAEERRSPAERLLAAGMAAFTRSGFAEVTVDEVCRSAELAKGSFYLHYASKEELFFASARAAGAEVGRAFAQRARVLRAGGADGAGPPGPGGLSEAEAGCELERCLTGRLPLLLDLLALAAQRRPGHAEAARAVFSDLRRGIRAHLRPPVADGADRRVVGEALVLGIRHVIGVIDNYLPPGA